MRRIQSVHWLAGMFTFLGLLLLTLIQTPGQQETQPHQPMSQEFQKVVPIKKPAPKPLVLPAKSTVIFFDDHFRKKQQAFDKSFNLPLRELTLDDGSPEMRQAGTSKGEPGTITVQCCQELANQPRKFIGFGTSTKYLPQLQYQDRISFGLGTVASRE